MAHATASKSSQSGASHRSQLRDSQAEPIEVVAAEASEVVGRVKGAVAASQPTTPNRYWGLEGGTVEGPA